MSRAVSEGGAAKAAVVGAEGTEMIEELALTE
ncbi:hypothetical protein SSPS47_20200 [Streptomyces sp. S4.7]|nr:hypothetical protein SSPS47_20200 [Streptomyces sp. S4.7]